MTIDRRTFLKRSGGGTAGVAMGALTPAVAAVAAATRTADADALGTWGTDGNGLPTYAYAGALPAHARDSVGADAQEAPDPSFLIGNYRITVFAHVSGILQILTGERVWARVNAADGMNYGANAAQLTIDGTTHELVGLTSLAADAGRTRRVFGCGFARWTYAVAPGLTVRRVVSVSPSTKINTGNPAVVVSTTIVNDRDDPLPFAHRESVRNHYVPANEQRTAPQKRAALYPASVAHDRKRSVVLATTRHSPTDFAAPRTADDDNLQDLRPVNRFLSARVANGQPAADISGSNDDAMAARFAGSVPARGSVTFHTVFGLTYGGVADAAAQVADLFDRADERLIDDGLFGAAWLKRLPRYDRERDPAFRTEMIWNAYALEAMATYSAYFGETFVPQGVIYAYEDGENISNRDNLQAMLPLCYTNPALAKSCLRHVLKQTTPIGEIKRGTSGFGYVSPGIYKESDEQLYLFMAVGEYLRITQDYGILDEEISYYPRSSGDKATTLTLLFRHFVYLRDEVSVGQHGLIRILNSDWSDAFFHVYSPNATLGSAESHLNTAMALAVMPNFIAGLKAARNKGASAFIDALERYVSTLSAAYFADLGERDFSARAYLNDGKPSYGKDIVCLEPQGFLLQIADVPTSRKRAIYARVRRATFDPERIGFRIRERPIFGGKGEGEDGGIWLALEHQMVRGVATFDRAEARRLLKVMSFQNYARQYPRYWLGRWTNFDSMQSSLSSREGLLNYWRKTYADCSYGYCSHAHSWPLYNYHWLMEADADRSSAMRANG